EIARLGDGQNRAENLFLKNSRFRIDIGDGRRLDEIAITFARCAAGNEASFFFADFDVVEDRFLGSGVNDRSHVIAEIFRRAHFHAGNFAFQLFDEFVVNSRIDNRAGTGRAFLSLITERGDEYALYGVIEVRFAIDDDGIFAAHLRNHALYPELTLLRLRRQLVDTQADVARSSERDETSFWMRHQRVADGAARTGKQRKTLRRESGFEQRFGEFRGNGRRVARRLDDDSVACDQGSRGHAEKNGQREIPRRNDEADAERKILHLVALAA